MLFKHVLLTLLSVYLLMISSSSRADALFSEDPKAEEAVYLFSYHCLGCFMVHDHVALWAKVNKIKLRRIPVFTDNDQWEKGAMIYFILKQYSVATKIPFYKFEKTGFAITNKLELRLNDPDAIRVALENVGVALTPSVFEVYWSIADSMILKSKQLLDEMQGEHLLSTPMFRLSIKGKVSWVLADETSDNPGLQLIHEVSTLLREGRQQ